MKTETKLGKAFLKVKPVTKIYKRTDLNKEDRRKFIKKVYLSWKAKREQDLMKNKVDLTI